MKIKGIAKRDTLSFVFAIMTCEELNIYSKPIRLCVDTGATNTTIMDADADKLAIDYSKLKESKQGALGIGGIVKSYEIGKMTLEFKTDNDELVQKEEIADAHVLRHIDESPSMDLRLMNMMYIFRLPSLLGLSVLRNYHIYFEDETVILEKP